MEYTEYHYKRERAQEELKVQDESFKQHIAGALLCVREVMLDDLGCGTGLRQLVDRDHGRLAQRNGPKLVEDRPARDDAHGQPRQVQDAVRRRPLGVPSQREERHEALQEEHQESQVAHLDSGDETELPERHVDETVCGAQTAHDQLVRQRRVDGVRAHVAENRERTAVDDALAGHADEEQRRGHQVYSQTRVLVLLLRATCDVAAHEERQGVQVEVALAHGTQARGEKVPLHHVGCDDRDLVAVVVREDRLTALGCWLRATGY